MIEDRTIASRPRLMSATLFGARLLGAVIAGCLCGSAAGQTPHWEQTPYRIAVELRVEGESRLAAVRAGIEWLAADIVGSAWQCTLGTESSLASSAFDQQIVVQVSDGPSGIRILAQASDAITQAQGPRVEREVPNIEQLADEAARAVGMAFVPVAQVASVRGTEVMLRPRAAALLAPGRVSPALPAMGTVLRPIRVPSEAGDKPRQCETIDGTLLEVEGHDDGNLRCRTVSRYATVRIAPRIGESTMALGMNPSSAATRLRLVAQGNAASPLAGCQVFVESADRKTSTRLGETDEGGTIDVPVQPASTLARLLIQRGEDFVARIPLVPGFEPTTTVAVADDPLRLEAEWRTIGLQEELVDLLARRQILVARARAALSAGQLDETQKLLDLAKQLSVRPLIDGLEMQRQRLRSSQAREQVRIRQLFEDTRTILDRFAAAPEVAEVEREWAAAKRKKS